MKLIRRFHALAVAGAVFFGVGAAHAGPGSEGATQADVWSTWGAGATEGPASIDRLGPAGRPASWPSDEPLEEPRSIAELGPESVPAPWPAGEPLDEPRSVAELGPSGDEGGRHMWLSTKEKDQSEL